MNIIYGIAKPELKNSSFSVLPYKHLLHHFMKKSTFINMITSKNDNRKKVNRLLGCYILLFLILLTGTSNYVRADHYTPVWGDQNPLVWMNVVVTNAYIDGVSITANDEIAVFDIDPNTGEEICVGVTVLSSGTGPFFVNAGQDNGDGGFTAGNSILFRLWDASTLKEITLLEAVFDLTPPLIDVYTPNGLASAAISAWSYNTWFGNTNGDWNTASNWDTGIVPSASNDVYIPASGVANFPELNASSNAECDNITLEATPTERASILGNQYLTVNGISKVQSYISADKWHIISPPVINTNVGFFALGGDPKVYLTEFDEASETYNYLTDPTTLLDEMQGYMLWVCDEDHLYEYSGSMHSGTNGSTDNLTRNTSSSGNEGWNMVGNPYPSSIDWDASTGWTKSANLGGAVYFFNNGIWEYYLDDSPSGHSANGSRYIAPGQGFFVRVLSGTTATLIMDEDVRIHNNTEFFKSRETTSYIKLSVMGNGKQDETIIRFKEEATNNFDGAYDVFKKFSVQEDCPQIYSNTDQKYYINSLASAEQVPISFYAGFDGNYKLSTNEIENIGNIWIEDLLTGAYFDLTNGDYNFDYAVSNDPERFVLHFTPVGLQKNRNDLINIYSSGKQVYLQSNEAITGTVQIHSLLGQLIVNEAIDGNQMNLTLNQKGYYIVSVNTDKINTTKKLFIK